MGPMSGLTEVHKIQLPILQAYAPLGLFCAEEFQISFTPRLYDCFFPPTMWIYKESSMGELENCTLKAWKAAIWCKFNLYPEDFSSVFCRWTVLSPSGSSEMQLLGLV